MGSPARPTASAGLRLDTTTGRLVVVASVAASGAAFLDATVVNAALPHLADDLDTDLAGVQWVVTAYLLALGALLVVGALGDRYGRRRLFLIGVAGFGLASLACGLAPNIEALVAARVAKGVFAAALSPASLALLSASFVADDRGRAIGLWSGLSGVASAVGPFLGGWMIDEVSWRWAFFVGLPLAALAIGLALRVVPESADPDAARRVDWLGAALLTGGLAGVVNGLIAGPDSGWNAAAVGSTVAGAAALAAFVVVEAHAAQPMVPLGLFGDRHFNGANLVTLGVYAALGALSFLLVVHLQSDLGYSALEAGAALLPSTVLMLLFSSTTGGLAQRFGPRPLLVAGPAVIAVSFVLTARIDAGDTYVSSVLPAVVVFGVGLVLTVAPLTTAVLAAVDDRHQGLAGAVNTAVARLAALLAVAVVPAVAGLGGAGSDLDLSDGFGRAMLACTLLSAAAVVAAAVLLAPARNPERATDTAG